MSWLSRTIESIVKDGGVRVSDSTVITGSVNPGQKKASVGVKINL